MFGVHQPHPTDPLWPKWSATKWPTPHIEMMGSNKVVVFVYHKVEWYDRKEDAEFRQRQFDAEPKPDVSALYKEAAEYNKQNRAA